MIDEPVMLSQAVRERIARDYRPVTVLRSPIARTMWLVPVAAMALVAAPIVFNVRSDSATLGWLGTWGVSSLQFALGLAVVAAALRESIPGRGWSTAAIALWLAMPIATVIAVTMMSWQASQVLLRGGWWLVGGMCFAGSAATALPVVAMAAVLAARAYPTRPVIAGALIGAGAGLIADGGWRMFCHFTEPAHVLSAHLAAVIMSAAIGMLVSVGLTRRTAAR